MEVNLSFENLDNLIETCALELQQYQNRFQNQSDDLTKGFWMSAKSSEKLHNIDCRMNVLRSINSQIEVEIENANAFIKEMENKIDHFEKEVKPLYCKSPVDEHREKMYGIADNINTVIYNYKDEVELLHDSKITDIAKCQDSVENIAKMMSKLLEDLETLEINLEKMKSHIHCVNLKQKSLEEK